MPIISEHPLTVAYAALLKWYGGDDLPGWATTTDEVTRLTYFATIRTNCSSLKGEEVSLEFPLNG